MPTARITSIESLAPEITQLTLALSGRDFAFAPGQYVSLQLTPGVSRAYTIASAPERPEALQFCIRLSGGKGSTAIRTLNVGDQVELDGPFGEFLVPSDGRDLLFLAGDTGIAPVRSIVLHLLATDDRRSVMVLYEPDGTPLYAADLEPLAEAQKIMFDTGRVETLIDRNRDALADRVVMISGFEDFLDRVRAKFELAELDFDQAIVETFGR